MASYGGYAKTSYGAQGGEDGGGFMGGSQQGSQGGGSKYADDSLRPVTIKQLLDCKEAYPGADLTVDGQAVTQITIVGQVRSVHPQTTNITYKIDDGTAVTDVKKWVDAEKAEDTNPQFAPDTYVRVYGRITTFNGKKHVGAHFIRPIDDFNEVNYHLLEATYVHLSLTKGAPGQQGGNAAGNTGDDGMFVDNYGGDGGNTGGGGGGSNARVTACSLKAQKMYNFLQTTPGASEGINCNAIAGGTGLSMRDVMAAADELLGQGLVYTTLDDETWAVLDY